MVRCCEKAGFPTHPSRSIQVIHMGSFSKVIMNVWRLDTDDPSMHSSVKDGYALVVFNGLFSIEHFPPIRIAHSGWVELN